MHDRAHRIGQTLGVGYGDRIAFRVENGGISVRAVTDQREDPALAPFLALLERDIGSRPEGIALLTPAMVAHITAATEGVIVDLGAPIEGTVAL